MGIAKIGRIRDRKKKLNPLEQLLLVLNYSHKFGKGMLPHNTGGTSIRKILVEYNTKDYKERANYKTTRQYLLYLMELCKIELQCYHSDKQRIKKMILEAEELIKLTDIELENLK